LTINCLIIDDEPLARNVLKQFIAQIDFLTLSGTCANAVEAMAFLKTNPTIDVLFLDINMPKISGLSFYKSLAQPPQVIFTTAYPQYAVEGFDLNAIDYLLKPFSFERFLTAVNRIIDQAGKKDNNSEYLLIKSNKVIHKVQPKTIQYVEAYGDYVKVILKDQQIVTNSTFGAMLVQLEPYQFIRIHKSFAINIGLLNSVQGNKALIGDKVIPIGQKYKVDFLERLGSI